MQEILGYGYLIVVVIALGVFLAIARQVAAKFKEKNDSIITDKAIDSVMKIVETGVDMIEQTYVKDLKDKGKFGPAEHEEAFNGCKTAILAMIGSNLKSILDKIFGNTDKFLNSAIEKKVLERKEKDKVQ